MGDYDRCNTCKRESGEPNKFKNHHKFAGIKEIKYEDGQTDKVKTKSKTEQVNPSNDIDYKVLYEKIKKALISNKNCPEHFNIREVSPCPDGDVAGRCDICLEKSLKEFEESARK
jgi:hypothetical protein